MFYFNSLNEVGTSDEWKVMISMNQYSHSNTGTLQHITKTTQSRRETERETNNRDGEEVRKWDLDRLSLSTGKPLFVRVASVGGQSVLRQVEYCSP